MNSTQQFLKYIMKSEEEAAINYLYEQGEYVDVNSVGREGNSALFLAAAGGLVEIVHALASIPHCIIDARDYSGFTPLHAACMHGHTEVVRELIRMKADVNATARNWRRPLHCAAEFGSEDIANLLIENSADTDPEDYVRDTPLHLACLNGHLPLVKLLLSKSSNINSIDENGTTPLMKAALQNHVNIVNLLLVYSCPLTGRNKFGHTALHCAVIKGHLSIIRLLLKAGADVNIKSATMSTLLDVAVRNGPTEVAVLLLKHGADPGDHLQDKDGLDDLFKAHQCWVAWLRRRSFLMFILGFQESLKCISVFKAVDENCCDEGTKSRRYKVLHNNDLVRIIVSFI